MIIINTELVYCVFYRNNDFTQWQYTEYCGRYDSAEAGIMAVMSRHEHGEYRIEHIDGGLISQHKF